MQKVRTGEVENGVDECRRESNGCFVRGPRVVKIDVYYTIRPIKRTPGTKVD